VKVAIHQSQYLPWPPYFRKLAKADVFVVMDSVQYQKNGVQNRNQLRNAAGPFWLTIPVTGQLEDSIAGKKLADDRWRAKHKSSLSQAYARAPFWKEFGPALAAVYERPFETLGAVNDAFLSVLLEAFGLKTRVVTLSSLNVPGAASELVLNACKALGATAYLSGTGAKDYLDEAAFAAAGLPIVYEESKPPVYAQFHGGEFVPGLSAVDHLLNAGPDNAREYLLA
jgi:hypothetical protein